MCGRYVQKASTALLSRLFQVEISPYTVLQARYNIAPGSIIPIIREERGFRELAPAKWGLLPGWVRDPGSFKGNLFNARSETLEEKPSFKHALKYRRCLIPADGFYEWQRVGEGKQPHFVHLLNSSSFAFAGLWERWEGASGIMDTCTVITTRANSFMQEIHDRMPVIIDQDDYNLWLDSRIKDGSKLEHLFAPYPSDEMSAYPVTQRVNNAEFDDEGLMEPLEQV